MLFDTLAAAYAGQWLAKWEGLDMEKVKSIWVKELDGLKVRHIKHGLAKLPTDHPPNAMKFREICLQAPEPFVPCLPEPYAKPDPVKVAEVLAPLLASAGGPKHGAFDLGWAWRMRDYEINHGGEIPGGAVMRQYHRDAWRIALKHGKYAPGGEAGT